MEQARLSLKQREHTFKLTFRSRRRRCCLSSLITQGVNSRARGLGRADRSAFPARILFAISGQAGAQGIHFVSFSSKILLSFTVTTFGFLQRHSL